MAKLAPLPLGNDAPQTSGAEVHHIRRLQPQFYAFLSYSHRDKETADWLYKELENFRVPRSLEGRLAANGVIPKRLRPIFRDEHELAAADDLGEEIRSALASSQFLVVLCSPNAAKSRWTNAEVEAFKRIRPEGCALAVIVSGEPFASEIPGREGEECLPVALRQRYDRRGRPTGKRAEPLAADLRGNPEERRIGFLKLVAGMLGVGLDELVQRETTRRHRRLAWLTAASLAGMAVTSTLALTAIQARDAARDQRREAEGLVAFMLGDLKDKLEPIGRLDALDGVGSRVLAYYSKQDTSELSDLALLQRAQALSLTAQVAYLRGNYEGAMHLYREAMAGTAEAVRRSPGDPQRLFDHAQNVFWLGELSRQQGRVSEAEAAYREYKRLADRMVAAEPDNLKWRMEVAYASENLGIVLMNQRRFSEAALQLARAIKPIESVASIDPNNSGYQIELAKAFGWWADSEKALGKLDAAIAIRQRQVSYLNQRLANTGSDVGLVERLIPAHQALGGLFTSRGDGERGVEEYRLALARATRLISVEPDNSGWKEMAASVRLELATSLLGMGRRAEAEQEAAAGCDMVAALRAKDANVSRWRMLSTDCLALRTRLALAAGANAPALGLAEQSLAASRQERSSDPVSDRYNVAAAYRLLGDVRRSLGEKDAAMAAWSAGLAALPTNIPERPWELNERAVILQRLGRSDEARPLRQRLAAIGFHAVN